jgi:hypothetical protein
MPLLLRGSIGRVRPDVAGGVGLIDEVRQLRAVVPGGVHRSLCADQAVGAVDADMVLAAEGGARSTRFAPSSDGLAFEYLTVHRAS